MCLCACVRLPVSPGPDHGPDNRLRPHRLTHTIWLRLQHLPHNTTNHSLRASCPTFGLLLTTENRHIAKRFDKEDKRRHPLDNELKSAMFCGLRAYMYMCVCMWYV